MALPAGSILMVPEGSTFKEWKSTGSLLWIHGKCMFCSPYVVCDLMSPGFVAGSGTSILWFVVLHPLYRGQFEDANNQNHRFLLLLNLTQLSAH